MYQRERKIRIVRFGRKWLVKCGVPLCFAHHWAVQVIKHSVKARLNIMRLQQNYLEVPLLCLDNCFLLSLIFIALFLVFIVILLRPFSAFFLFCPLLHYFFFLVLHSSFLLFFLLVPRNSYLSHFISLCSSSLFFVLKIA